MMYSIEAKQVPTIDLETIKKYLSQFGIALSEIFKNTFQMTANPVISPSHGGLMPPGEGKSKSSTRKRRKKERLKNHKKEKGPKPKK